MHSAFAQARSLLHERGLVWDQTRRCGARPVLFVAGLYARSTLCKRGVRCEVEGVVRWLLVSQRTG